VEQLRIAMCSNSSGVSSGAFEETLREKVPCRGGDPDFLFVVLETMTCSWRLSSPPDALR